MIIYIRSTSVIVIGCLIKYYDFELFIDFIFVISTFMFVDLATNLAKPFLFFFFKLNMGMKLLGHTNILVIPYLNFLIMAKEECLYI